ncbi:uncharacterized protein BX663DRAFT_19712 [Cokeromyces recurvatus]|uniref:uncharacterized protein n=1 Tax=Cokeromyces recurvatus TaxID=90255 RepID=UPI00221E8A6A|nr:uncharacterized protein BX663DRAFT_19712 [Cokeromyces recurvatus]KAI7908079.1 hypothetical protein BX663DRAFT_19712 [Cokeromyces recurvatus]
MLKSIQKFEPFIDKNQDKGFFLDRLLGLKISNEEPINKATFKEEENSLLSDVFLNLQTHIKEQMLHLNMEQKVLLKRIAYVDELSLTNFQKMVASLQQARLVADKIPEALIIKKQAEKAKSQAIKIFKSLSVIEEYIEPEDRILLKNKTKWPELSELREQAIKQTQQPPFERYISNTNDVTISTTAVTTSPLLETVIAETGESTVNWKHTATEEEDKNLMSKKLNTAPSLALNHLRELSSRTSTSNIVQ